MLFGLDAAPPHAARTQAIRPPAPERFSTTTGCPSLARSFSAMIRPGISVGPPAGKPITSRTGRSG